MQHPVPPPHPAIYPRGDVRLCRARERERVFGSDLLLMPLLALFFLFFLFGRNLFVTPGLLEKVTWLVSLSSLFFCWFVLFKYDFSLLFCRVGVRVGDSLFLFLPPILFLSPYLPHSPPPPSLSDTYTPTHTPTHPHLHRGVEGDTGHEAEESSWRNRWSQICPSELWHNCISTPRAYLTRPHRDIWAWASWMKEGFERLPLSNGERCLLANLIMQ